MKRPLWHVIRHEIAPRASPREAADHVLRRMRVVAPPVQVEQMAVDMDVTIVPISNLEVAGILTATRDVAFVTVNESDSPERIRFTIAHELGHLLQHAVDGKNAHYRDVGFGPTPDKKEVEANEFAASLLMPLWLVEPLAIGAKRTTKQLAEMFKVSQRAMEVQLKKLLSR